MIPSPVRWGDEQTFNANFANSATYITRELIRVDTPSEWPMQWNLIYHIEWSGPTVASVALTLSAGIGSATSPLNVGPLLAPTSPVEQLIIGIPAHSISAFRATIVITAGSGAIIVKAGVAPYAGAF